MSTAPRLIIEIDPAFFEIIERTRARVAALAARVGSDPFPLPWTGKVELIPISVTDDNDAPFVVRDASGAEIATLYERYQDGKPLHELAGERIVALADAVVMVAPAALAPPASDNPEIRAAILHDRESCAFLAECHSGLWDPATIDQIAANIRARGEESARELVHLDPDRYGTLLAAEGELRALKARAAPKALRDAITAACFDPQDAAGNRSRRTDDEWRADAVMAVLRDLGVIAGEGGR